MQYTVGQVPETIQVALYEAMLRPRMIEEKMIILLRQGKITKWFSGIGQEAIAVGVTMALDESEYILPMHRNLGVFTTRNVPLQKLFSQWQGKEGGFTKGRDRSFHFGSQEHKIIGMISHLGPQLGVADGIALAHKLRNEKKVTAVFSGEGGTSEGDFHEALNVASVWDLPVIFCVENNGYGLSTPTHEQYKCENLADRGKGYGIEAHIIEGNNILEVYTKVSAIAEDLRNNPRPVLIEFKTFRVRGHEESSGTAYVPETLIAEWKDKDPIANYEQFLIKNKLISQVTIKELREEISSEIGEALWLANKEPQPIFSLTKELGDVYKPFVYEFVEEKIHKKNCRFIDAISDGLRGAMETDDRVVLMGQDIAEYGGAFKITEGFAAQFGKERVRNTPICESAIVATAMGLSINGMKAVVEMQFADFAATGFNPIVNYLAKSHYRWGEKANVVIRMPCGGGVSAGPFHSQTNEAWFTKTPGLKVVYPAFPSDAKGLLQTAINDPNPVLFFEHKALYRSITEDVATNNFTIPFGEALLHSIGTMATIVTYGAGVHWALEVLDNNEALKVDLIDLRTLQPLDTACIFTSVRKTGRLLILQEDSLFGGIASDISAMVTEQCFKYLDAPVKRVGSLDTPIPFNATLEQQYLGKSRLKASLKALIAY